MAGSTQGLRTLKFRNQDVLELRNKERRLKKKRIRFPKIMVCRLFLLCLDLPAADPQMLMRDFY
jgi:hypothetical protein